MPKGQQAPDPASTLPALPPPEPPALPSGVSIHINPPPRPPKRDRPAPPPAPAVPMPEAPEPSRFESFLDSLKSAEGLGEGRTELELRLNRLDKVEGQDRWAYTGLIVRYSADDIASGQEPDLETMALDHAKQTGRFGVYRWNIRGWADGFMKLDTSKGVVLDPPADYVPKVKEPPPEPAGPGKSAQEIALDMLGLAKGLAGIGGNAPDPNLIETIRAAARQEGYNAGELAGQLKAAEDWRQRLEDKVADAKKEAHALGVKEGRWELKDEYQAKISELEKGQDKPETLVGEVVASLGGPAGLQGLLGAIMAPRQPAPVQPAPMALPAAPRPLPPPQVRPNPFPPSQLPEPTRAEHHAALEELEILIETMHEAAGHGDPNPEFQAALDAFQAFKAEGLKDGPLGAWWARWIQGARAETQRFQASLDAHMSDPDETEPPAGDDVKVEQLKTLLVQRLKDGAEPEAIIQELAAQIPADDLETMKTLIRSNGRPMVHTFLGIPAELQARANVALDLFSA